MDLSPDAIMTMLQAWAGDPVSMLLMLALVSLFADSAAVLAAALLVGNDKLGAVEATATLSLSLLAGDGAIFLFGWLAREQPFLARHLPKRRLEETANWLAPRQASAIILARFIPGSRSITFLACGFLQLSVTRFLIADGLSCTATTVGTILFAGTVTRFFADYGLVVSSLAGLAAMLILILPAYRFARKGLKDLGEKGD